MTRNDEYLLFGALRRVQVITVKKEPDVSGPLRRVVERGEESVDEKLGQLGYRRFTIQVIGNEWHIIDHRMSDRGIRKPGTFRFFDTEIEARKRCQRLNSDWINNTRSRDEFLPHLIGRNMYASQGQRYGRYKKLGDAYKEALGLGWKPDKDNEGVFVGYVTVETDDGAVTYEQRLMAQELNGEWFLRVIDESDLIKRGGPDSGHHGHRGRPGEVGGSQPGDGVEAVKVGGGVFAEIVAEKFGIAKDDDEFVNSAWITTDGQGLAPGEDHEWTAEVAIAEVEGISVEEIQDDPDRSGANAVFELIGEGLIRHTDFQGSHGFLLPADWWITSEQEEAIVVLMSIAKGKNPRAEFTFELHDPTKEGMKLELVMAEEAVRRLRLSRDFWDISAYAVRKIVARGGPGSGHHGHRGRVGETGGSEPGKGAPHYKPGVGAPRGYGGPQAGGARAPAAAAAGTAQTTLADVAPDDSATVAQYSHTQAQQSEPELTGMMESLAEASEGRLEGLEFSVKEADRLQEKIERDMKEKGISAQEAASEINDRNRYTIVLGSEEFVAKVAQVQTELENQGWTQYDHKYKNFFGGGDTYDGYNTVVVHESGQRFELQFHTEETIRIKEQIHPLYQRFSETTDPAERVNIYMQMADAYVDVVRPEGFEQLPGRLVYQEEPE